MKTTTGSAPDRHPRSPPQGLGEPADPIRSAWPARAHPEASSGPGAERLRVRFSGGRVRGSFKTAWESLLLVANGHNTRRAKPGARVDREKRRKIDLHWHDLRHEGACRLLAGGVDIRVVQLILGHSDIKTTQRYLNMTDEELRKALTGVWERRRQLKAVGQ
jgi:integrase